jgi:ferrochelatase
VTTAIEKTQSEIKKLKLNSLINFLPTFYDQEFYIDSLAKLIDEDLEDFNSNHYLFSYHGIPKSHLKGYCPLDKSDTQCCDKITQENKNCYRAQCFETSRLLAKKLSLNEDQYTTSFQSRLGKAEWIRPYISESLDNLAKMEVKNLILFSPSFIVDCLETIEELALSIKADYINLVPEAEVKYISCLNEDTQFAKVLSTWIKQKSLT